MTDPKIAARRPAVLELAAGRYAYCTCGQSARQPFCDGSHAGSEFRPAIFELAEPATKAICQCKHTGNAPYCDGTHGRLP